MVDSRMYSIDEVWSSRDEALWLWALEQYGEPVKESNRALERELATLKLETIEALDEVGWYEFLRDKYFRWKFTAPNRYKTTTNSLSWYVTEGQLGQLSGVKEELLRFDREDIRRGLQIGTKIRGLGVAGASGLLSVLYPQDFGTVDQFVVKGLLKVESMGVEEREALTKMNPEGLRLPDG